MVAIGWSFGDIAAAIKILWHVIEAFDKAKGASRQHADSCAFLRGLILVLKYLQSPDGQHLPTDVLDQAKAIFSAYEQFDKYLDKYHHLSSARPHDVKRVLGTIKWSLDELHGKVQKIKETALSAVAVLETLVVLDLSTRISHLQASGDHQGASLSLTQAAIQEVRDHTVALTQATSDYQAKLDVLAEENRGNNTDVDTIKQRIESMEKSQLELSQGVKLLIEHIEKQRILGADQAEAHEWSELQVEAQDQNKALADLKTNQEHTQESLDKTHKVLSGMGNLTQNHRLTRVSDRVGGVGDIVNVLGPGITRVGGSFGKFFGCRTNTHVSPRPTDHSTPSHPPNAMKDIVEKPTRKPAPPMPLSPPPKRLTN